MLKADTCEKVSLSLLFFVELGERKKERKKKKGRLLFTDISSEELEWALDLEVETMAVSISTSMMASAADKDDAVKTASVR